MCCCRGLQSYLNHRRKLLSYLRRDNFPRYAFVLHKLGLKDTYAKQVSCKNGGRGGQGCVTPGYIAGGLAGFDSAVWLAAALLFNTTPHAWDSCCFSCGLAAGVRTRHTLGSGTTCCAAGVMMYAQPAHLSTDSS